MFEIMLSLVTEIPVRLKARFWNVLTEWIPHWDFQEGWGTHGQFQSLQVPRSGPMSMVSCLCLRPVALCGGKSALGWQRGDFLASSVEKGHQLCLEGLLTTHEGLLSGNNIGKLKNRLKHWKGLLGCQVKDQGLRRPQVLILLKKQPQP